MNKNDKIAAKAQTPQCIEDPEQLDLLMEYCEEKAGKLSENVPLSSPGEMPGDPPVIPCSKTVPHPKATSGIMTADPKIQVDGPCPRAVASGQPATPACPTGPREASGDGSVPEKPVVAESKVGTRQTDFRGDISPAPEYCVPPPGITTDVAQALPNCGHENPVGPMNAIAMPIDEFRQIVGVSSSTAYCWMKEKKVGKAEIMGKTYVWLTALHDIYREVETIVDAAERGQDFGIELAFSACFFHSKRETSTKTTKGKIK